MVSVNRRQGYASGEGKMAATQEKGTPDGTGPRRTPGREWDPEYPRSQRKQSGDGEGGGHRDITGEGEGKKSRAQSTFTLNQVLRKPWSYGGRSC